MTDSHGGAEKFTMPTKMRVNILLKMLKYQYALILGYLTATCH